MDINRLKPSGQREWGLVAAGAAAALILAAVVTGRYDYRALPGDGRNVLRIDRWTGQAARCYVTCQPVIDQPPPPGANPFDRFDHR